MSLPALSKTWAFSVNNTQAAQGTVLLDGQLMMFNIKQALVAAGWTVVRSSNSASVANSDLWAATTNLVWSTGNHSWIVLQNTALNTNFQICIALLGSNPYGIVSAFCQGGYNLTTGTISGRPTATTASDEIVLLNQTQWGLATSTLPYVWHLMYSTDLQITRILIMQAGVVCGFHAWEKPQAPVTGWTNPHITIGIGVANSTQILTHTNMYTATDWVARLTSGLGTNTISHYLGGEGFNNSLATAAQVTPSDITASYPMLPISLWSSQSPARGRNGQLFDCWWGIENNPNGTSYPSSGTLYQFVQFGPLIFPWQSNVAPLTA